MIWVLKRIVVVSAVSLGLTLAAAVIAAWVQAVLG